MAGYFSEIAATTIENRQKKLTNNVLNHNVISQQMKEHNMVKTNESGKTLVEEMSIAENGTFKRYNGGQLLNISKNQTLSAAEFEPKQFAVAVVTEGREIRQNSGEEGFIKLLTARIQVAEDTLANNFNSDLISDGTADGGLQIGGLKFLISKTPTTGTVGGINRALAENAFYRNYKFDTVNDWAGGVASASNIKELYGKVLDNTQVGSEGTKFILAGKNHYGFVRQASQAIQIITDPKMAKLGFRNIWFCEVPVVLASSVNFGGQAQVQDDLSYFIDPKGMSLRIYKGANFERLQSVQAINQDAEAQLIIWMGALTLSRAKTQAVLFDS